MSFFVIMSFILFINQIRIMGKINRLTKKINQLKTINKNLQLFTLAFQEY